jgi:molybdate transport system substrate-binding protein
LNNHKRIISTLLLLLILASCSNTTSNSEKVIHISAASSLKGPVTEWEHQFEKNHPNINIKANFGASGVLINQIKKGAPADLFFSAQNVDRFLSKSDDIKLIKAGIVASNELVFVVNKNVHSPAVSLNKVPTDAKLGIGEPKLVPAGYYAKKALEHVKKKRFHIIYSQNAVHLKGLVESGTVDYALMYKSDAVNNKKIKILETIPQNWYPEIEYPVYRLKGAQNESKQFWEYIHSAKGQKILKKYTFRKSVNH